MASDIAHSGSSIAHTFLRCSNSFETVIRSYSIAEKHIKDRVPYGAIADERGRFRVWSASALADQRGIGSLDYRLRDASNIASQLLLLLNSLLDVLEEIREILDGERPCLEDDSDSVSECSASELRIISEATPESELVQLLSNVVDIITCLMRLSIAVHDPAPHDQITSMSSINISDLEKSDVGHVQEKFPFAEEFLKERLGCAMSHWRHYMQYRVDQNGDVWNDFEKQIPGPTRAEIARVSRVSHHKETLLPNDNHPGSSSVTISETPIMTSAQRQDAPLRSSSSALDQVVPSFKCPVCIRHVHVRTLLEWKEHVYQDLRAYVCTFEDCMDPDRRFDTRQEWFDHEMQAHRRWWECIDGCNERLRSYDAFRIHFQHHHAKDISQEHLQIIMGTCSRPIAFDTQADCPLCELSCSSLSRLCSHLGQHQESLCLSVLPADLMDHAHKFLESDEREIVLSHVLEDPSITWPRPGSLVQKDSSSRTAHTSVRQGRKKLVGSTANPVVHSGLSETERRAMDSRQPVSRSESSEEDIEHRNTPHTGKGKQVARPQLSQITEMPKISPPDAPEPESIWVSTAGNFAHHNSSHGELRDENQEDLEDRWSEQSEPLEETYEDNPLGGNRINRFETYDAAHISITDERGDEELGGLGPLEDDYVSGPRTMTYQSSNNQGSARRLPIPTRINNANVDDTRRALALMSENEFSKSSTRESQDLRPAVTSWQTPSLQSESDSRSKGISTELTSARALSTRSQQPRIIHSMTLMPKATSKQKGHTSLSGETTHSIARPVNTSESWALYYFETHARKCAYCHNPYEVHRNHENLCEIGHRLAQEIASHLYSKEGTIYSTKEEANRIVQVEIPSGYVEISGLFKAIERSLRHRSRRPFVSMNRNYYVAPRTPVAMPIRQKSVQVKHEKPRSKPSRLRSGEIVDWPVKAEINNSSSKRGSLYEEDLAKRRESAKDNVEIREPSARDLRDHRPSGYYR